MGHHERTNTREEMEEKLATIATRRAAERMEWKTTVRKSGGPNILLILADDLDYEDLSVYPFTRNSMVKSYSYGSEGSTSSIAMSSTRLLNSLSLSSTKVIDFSATLCHHGDLPTPNLERMARKGARATNFHAASPVCSPSRISS